MFQTIILSAVLCLVAQTKKQNFIFYQPDEMRAESLGCYGHNVSKTPNFDKFASEGTRFEQAHVSYTVCSQSRVSFMTGWPTHVRGHRTLWSLLHEWEPNLLKYLKSDNYTVMWWGKNDMLAEDSWNSSVTSARTMPGGNYGPNPYNLEDPEFYSFLNKPHPGNETSTKDYNNVYEAIKFLNSEESKKKPFMIFLPLSLPHPPYSCPEPFYSSIDPDDLPDLRAIPDEGNGKPDYHALIRQYRNLTSLDEKFFRKLHSVYLGSISYSDFLFGLLMAQVEENGHADDTTVAVFSDHGDYAGDYGLVEKWPSGLEDVLTRVPLIIRTPGGKKGHVVKEQVQLFDIVPTALEIANISAKHVHFGQSLVKQLFGEDGDPERAVFAEGGYATNEPRDFEGDESNGGLPTNKKNIYYPKLMQEQHHKLSVCRSAMVRTLTHKLVFRSDPTDPDHDSELYDLVKDPRETQNVYNKPEYAEIQAKLKEKLFIWFFQTSDVTPWKVDARNGGYPWPKQSLPIDFAMDTEEPIHYFSWHEDDQEQEITKEEENEKFIQ